MFIYIEYLMLNSMTLNGQVLTQLQARSIKRKLLKIFSKKAWKQVLAQAQQI